jgi:type IV secretion system protein TrbL
MFADVPVTHPSRIINDILQASRTWEPVIATAATSLLAMMAIVDLGWSALKQSQSGADITGIMEALQGKVMRYGLMLAFISLHWGAIIVNSLSMLGQRAAHVSTAVTPSAVFADGAEMMQSLLDSSTGVGLLAGPITSIPFIVGSILILLGFTYLTYHFVLFLAQTYMAIYSGLIYFGFGGMDFTIQYAERGITLMLAAGLRMLIFYLIVGLSHTFATRWWIASLATAPKGQNPITDTFVIVGECALFAGLARELPVFVSDWLQGSVSMSGHSMSPTVTPIGRLAATIAAIGVTGGLAGAGAAATAAQAAGGGIGKMGTMFSVMNGGWGKSAGPHQPSAPTTNGAGGFSAGKGHRHGGPRQPTAP